MTRGQQRAKFKTKLLTYSDIGSVELKQLRRCIRKELKAHHAAGNMRMKLKRVKYRDYSFNANDEVLKYHLKVDGWAPGATEPYFINREAISFNSDGFIGFAGWADNTNVQPFLRAFNNWVNELAKK